mmetsp:Transcript_88880/g.287494  ORF Transcript_88880/g.287494 Transcript_88880/m.287494 type:complete len:203 (+) Transcript_88880:1573-2181(+)
MHESSDRSLEIVLGHHLAGLLIAHLDLPILPTSDKLGNTIVVEVETINAIHPILRLDAPCPRELVVNADRPMHQRVSEALLVQRLHTDHHISLGDLLDDVFMVEHSHLEVLGATDQLSHAVVVHIAECECADIVACDGPEELGSLMVESLDRAISTDHAKRSVDVEDVAESNHIHAVVDLLEKQVGVFLDVVDHQGGLSTDH